MVLAAWKQYGGPANVIALKSFLGDLLRLLVSVGALRTAVAVKASLPELVRAPPLRPKLPKNMR